MVDKIVIEQNPIGFVHSCYKEKFGIPRQSGLVSSAAKIVIDASLSRAEAFRELDTFSHIWVIFIFHGIAAQHWRPTVRPPRLGGNKRIGVFASRSMFRPNPIGLSVVKLNKIDVAGKNIVLHISGGDFLDQTPVIDIKPYLPYSDSLPYAQASYASTVPEAQLKISFSKQAISQIEKAETDYPGLQQLITDILQLDPRPAYRKNHCLNKEFAMKLYDFDLKWQVNDKRAKVTALVGLK